MEPLPPPDGAKPAIASTQLGSGHTVQIDFLSKDASAANLADATFIVRVLGKKADGRWLLDANGSRLSAEAGALLRDGAVYLGRLLPGSPTALRLWSVKASSAPTLPASPPLELFNPLAAARADPLSAILVSLFKAFSLRLDQTALARLRALVSKLAQAKGGSEAALVAVAAQAKGLKLTDEALAAAVSDLDPDSRGGGQFRDKPKDQTEAKAENSSSEAEAKPENEEEAIRQVKPRLPYDRLSPLTLKQACESSLSSNTVLSWLGRIPQKDGRRWLAFPVSFGEAGEPPLEATIRLSLDERDGRLSRPEKLVVDALGLTRRWRAVAEFKRSALSLELCATPALAKEADVLENALRLAMEGSSGIGVCHIAVSPAPIPELPAEADGETANGVDEYA